MLPAAFFHPGWDVTMVVHGDDFLGEGEEEDLLKTDEAMVKEFDTKVLRRVGPGVDREGRYLHRVISWTEAGFGWAADPKHVDLILENWHASVTPKPKSSIWPSCM